MPTHCASIIVVNSVKESVIPRTNGMTNAMRKAARVGRTNIGKYFFSCINSPPNFVMLSHFSMSQ